MSPSLRGKSASGDRNIVQRESAFQRELFLFLEIKSPLNPSNQLRAFFMYSQTRLVLTKGSID